MNPKEIESIISYLEDTDTECMDLDMVLGWLRKLENAGAASKNANDRVLLMYTAGLARYRLGEFDRAIIVLEKALRGAESFGLLVYSAKIHCILSACYTITGDIKKAGRHSETALREFGRLRLFDELSLHYIHIIQLGHLINEKDEVLEYLHRAEYFSHGHTTSKSVCVLFGIAQIYNNILYDNIKGTKYLTRGIEICRMNGMVLMEKLGMKRLADTYLMMERYSEAADVYCRIISDERKRLPDSVCTSVRVSLVFCDFQLGRLISAEKRITELEEFLPRLWEKERKQFTAVACYLKARLIMIREDTFEEAEELLKKALAIFEKYGRYDFPVPEFDYMLYSLQASMLLRQGRLGGAERACKKLAETANHYSARCRRDAYARLSMIAELRGDYEAACHYAHMEDEAIDAIEAGNLALRFEQLCGKFFDTMRSREITGLKKENQTLKKNIDMDALTQVYNKKYYLRYLRRIHEGDRKDIQQLTVLMVDIDHFKEYNDYYGHTDGDKCLRRVAEILTNAADVFGAYVMRYGGEEFAIFLENFTEKDGEETARRIMDELAEAHIPHEASPVADHLTVSIGIASERRNIPREINALMERADEALYEVKRSGGNMFRTMQW